jgi:hypothetical protein
MKPKIFASSFCECSPVDVAVATITHHKNDAQAAVAIPSSFHWLDESIRIHVNSVIVEHE